MHTEDFTHLSLFGIYEYTAEPGSVFDALTAPRPCFFLGVMLKGSAVFESHLGYKESIYEGDLIFIPQGAKYRSVWGKECKNVYISVRFDFEP